MFAHSLTINKPFFTVIFFRFLFVKFEANFYNGLIILVFVVHSFRHSGLVEYLHCFWNELKSIISKSEDKPNEMCECLRNIKDTFFRFLNSASARKKKLKKQFVANVFFSAVIFESDLLNLSFNVETLLDAFFFDFLWWPRRSFVYIRLPQH